jgi:uncharacterized membrane protein
MNKHLVAIAFAAFLGMIDTFYVSIKHAQGPVPCHVTMGCEEVLNSRYSEVSGIPISWVGLVFYLCVFSGTVFEISGVMRTRGLIFAAALAAFLVSLALFVIQAFVLHAFCEYCLLSATLSTVIFAVSLSLRFSARRT